MRTYVSIAAPPSATVDEYMQADATLSLARIVHEPEPKVINTGLLDARGVKLYRVDTPNPIGFRAYSKP